MERVVSLCEQVASAFGFTISNNSGRPHHRRWTENPRCRDYYFKGYCKSAGSGCGFDHTSRSNETYHRFRVDLSRAEGDFRNSIEICYGFAMGLVTDYLNHDVQFQPSQYRRLIHLFEALCVLIDKDCGPIKTWQSSSSDFAKGGSKDKRPRSRQQFDPTAIEETGIFLTRFVRELFPWTLKFLQVAVQGAYLPDAMIKEEAQKTTKIESVVAVLSAHWTDNELARSMKYETFLNSNHANLDCDGHFIKELTQSVVEYCDDQTRTSEARNLIHIDIVAELKSILGSIIAATVGGDATCEYVIFGSSANTFGSSNSDVDIALRFVQPDPRSGTLMDRPMGDIEIVGLLTAISDYLLQQTPKRFEVLELIADARVPLLRLLCSQYNVNVDVCMNNPNALLNTKLLRDYGSFDARVRQLVMAVKLWASRRGVNSPKTGTLTSYAWTLLVIHFLQCGIYPPVLPTLQEPTAAASFVSNNTFPVGYLLLQFFRFFGNFSEYRECRVGKASMKCYAVHTSTSVPTDAENYYHHHDFYVHVADITHGCCFVKQCAMDSVTTFRDRMKIRRRTPRKSSESFDDSIGKDGSKLNSDDDEAGNEENTEAGDFEDMDKTCNTDGNPFDAASAADITTNTRIMDRSIPPAARNARFIWRMCIQDPFEEVDLGRVVWHPSSMRYIITEIRRVALVVMGHYTSKVVAGTAAAGTPEDHELLTRLNNLSVQKSKGDSKASEIRGAVPDSPSTLFDDITELQTRPLAIPFYCLLCGDSAHQTRSCPSVECSVCFNLGHGGYECPRIMCTNCRQRGHFRSKCPLAHVVKDDRRGGKYKGGGTGESDGGTRERKQRGNKGEGMKTEAAEETLPTASSVTKNKHERRQRQQKPPPSPFLKASPSPFLKASPSPFCDPPDAQKDVSGGNPPTPIHRFGSFGSFGSTDTADSMATPTSTPGRRSRRPSKRDREMLKLQTAAGEATAISVACEAFDIEGHAGIAGQRVASVELGEANYAISDAFDINSGRGRVLMTIDTSEAVRSDSTPALPSSLRTPVKTVFMTPTKAAHTPSFLSHTPSLLSSVPEAPQEEEFGMGSVPTQSVKYLRPPSIPLPSPLNKPSASMPSPSVKYQKSSNAKPPNSVRFASNM
jgi:hypothetical protein